MAKKVVETVIELTLKTAQGPVDCTFVHRTRPYQEHMLRMDTDVDAEPANIAIQNVWPELLKIRDRAENPPSPKKVPRKVPKKRKKTGT